MEETPDNTNPKSLEDMEAQINKQMEELRKFYVCWTRKYFEGAGPAEGEQSTKTQ